MSTPSNWASKVIYLVTVAYTTVLGGILLLVPLYAFELGYSVAGVGLIVALQAALQVTLRIPVGWICQQFGEKRTLLVSFVALAATAALLVVSASLAAMVAAQLVMGLSRAVFFVSVQSYAARVSDDGGGRRLGTTQGLQAFGQMIGPVIAGWLVGAVHYVPVFAGAAGLILLSLLLVLALPSLPTAAAGAGLASILAEARAIATKPPVVAAGGLTFVAALLRSLIVSFFPVFFAAIGLSAQLIGALMSARGLVEIAVSWWVGQVLDRGRRLRLLIAGYASAIVGLLLSAFADGWLVNGISVSLVGAASSMLHVQGLAIGSQAVERVRRGLAIGVNGTYWSVGLLLGPMAMGAAAQGLGMRPAVAAAAAVMAAAMSLSLGTGKALTARPPSTQAPLVTSRKE